MPCDQRAQPRIGQNDPTPGCHAVGDVDELFRGDVVEVAEYGFFQQLRMQRRDAIDRVTSDAGQVRHSYALASLFVDDRQPSDQLIVSWMAEADEVQESPVDLVNDFQMSWQQSAEQRQRPFLERLGKQRVVGVAAGALRDGPRAIPIHRVFVDEQPHQFRNRDRRVRVVQLRGPGRVKLVERLPTHQVQADHVLEGARHEEVLLRETQRLADVRLVVRIEHLRDRFRGRLLVDRAVVVADVERVQIERLGGFRLPQPQ